MVSSGQGASDRSARHLVNLQPFKTIPHGFDFRGVKRLFGRATALVACGNLDIVAGKERLGEIDSYGNNGQVFRPDDVDERLSLHHGILMPIRDFRPGPGTGKCLSLPESRRAPS
ncbi:hypothetical protein K8353_12015 [Burkholderia contaminans]|nr:hypothetical protein [Burkholderia contaminans]